MKANNTPDTAKTETTAPAMPNNETMLKLLELTTNQLKTAGWRALTADTKVELFRVMKKAEALAKMIKESAVDELKSDINSIPGLTLKQTERGKISDVLKAEELMRTTLGFTSLDIANCTSYSLSAVEKVLQSHKPDLSKAEVSSEVKKSLDPAITYETTNQLTIAL